MGDRKGLPLEMVLKKLDDFAPQTLAESWDNVGLLIEPSSVQISTILLTNDLTENVMEEALEVKANLIISYHPPIFRALKSITNSNWKGRIVSACLENRIALYSPHTCWDSVQNGLGEWLAHCLPVKTCIPIQAGTVPNTGMGRICELANEMTLKEAVEKVKCHVGVPYLRLAIARGKSLESKINTLAVCPGSGASILAGVKADLYVTGEMLHHDILDATHIGSHVIMCNHSDSERGYLKHFAQKLQSWFATEVKVVVSSRDEDPITTI
ncbi:NIF3-like protein 1 isoform X2 [Chrysoperla carnea]|nr:NIF3-like protein 1 isoform X2 [Chrysoperla carnea]